ncbi:hypothetical protein ABT369_39430 [Dactylosporangium sp. NPDC000244]|uniref:hypothetical protein n=1 Tax=Dactylosporangium sp. NPDC000244 TaxID=3154365 RepID=UPI003331F59C
MSDDIKVRWTVDLSSLNHSSGEVELPREDWDVLSVEDRYREIKYAVGEAVLRALDVDWTLLNARIDDPNR